MSDEAKKAAQMYGPLSDEAAKLTVLEFAERYASRQNIRLWGNPPTYSCVNVDGCDYLWNLKDGKYDGWDRGMQ
jgi:hypothetical protein